MSIIKKIVNKISKRRISSEKDRDNFIAPKGEKDEEHVEKFARRLHEQEKEQTKATVIFRDLEDRDVEKVLKKMQSMNSGLKLAMAKTPTLSGKINGENFIVVKKESGKDIISGESIVAQIISTESGIYIIRTSKDTHPQKVYKEYLTLKDGAESLFTADLERNNNRVFRMISKNGISMREIAGYAIAEQDYDFESFAQPSTELLKEYAETTGLPIICDCTHKKTTQEIKSKLKVASLTETMRREGRTDSYPYIISIEAHKKPTHLECAKNKIIKYVYNSQESFTKGEKPYMIYMSGIDGRDEYSGMFRLKGDSYIDNSTFRKENGRYTYDTVSYEQIMELAGKMPTQLSNRVKSVITGEFRMPPEIEQIYNKAMSIEKREQHYEDVEVPE